jgi:predicted 3-demethylubiquinone-9 3-methyltransferase (glyoxalase superfamily)
MQKITPFLWFNANAEEAVRFYTSVFKPSKIVRIARCGAAGPGKPGTVLTIQFRLLGQEFVALNGGPVYKFNPAISLVVNCKTQREIDTYWRKLCGGGGKPIECGWLTDKFGVSWQIVPAEIQRLIADKNQDRSDRVMQAVMRMTKLDAAELKRAHAGSLARSKRKKA